MYNISLIFWCSLAQGHLFDLCRKATYARFSGHGFSSPKSIGDMDSAHSSATSLLHVSEFGVGIVGRSLGAFGGRGRIRGLEFDLK